MKTGIKKQNTGKADIFISDRLTTGKNNNNVSENKCKFYSMSWVIASVITVFFLTYFPFAKFDFIFFVNFFVNFFSKWWFVFSLKLIFSSSFRKFNTLERRWIIMTGLWKTNTTSFPILQYVTVVVLLLRNSGKSFV